MVAAALLLFVTDIIPLCALQGGGVIVLPVLQLVSHASQRLPDLFIAVRGNSMEIIANVREVLSRVWYLVYLFALDAFVANAACSAAVCSSKFLAVL